MTPAERSYSAPGKVVLCGEYAVLHDARAIVMAVDRRALVRVSGSSGDAITLSCPGFDETEYRLRLDAYGGIEWLTPRPADGRFALLGEVLGEYRPQGLSGARLVLDTRAFSAGDSGAKYGLGSSAALAVALAAAFGADISDRPVLTARAQAAHSRFQGKLGSGIDIAAAVHGGLLEFRRAGLAAASLDWPAGLRVRLLWSGKPAQTAPRLGRLREGLRDSRRHASLESLKKHAEQSAAAFRKGDAEQLVGTLADYTSALRHFDSDHGLGIFAAGHAAVADAAQRAGLVYKPCGAGGGDIGAVFGLEASAVDEFCEDAAAAGFAPLDCGAGLAGVRQDG